MAKTGICPVCGGVVRADGRCWRCNPRPGPSPREDALDGRQTKIIAGVLTVSLFVLLLVAIIVAAQEPDSRSAADITSAGTLADTAVAYEAELGYMDYGLSSTEQAATLLALMSEEPGYSRYSINYVDPYNVVVFGCDLSTQVIIRLHQDPYSHGTVEQWNDYVIERLQNAAAGGSLNDTPDGKLYGTYDTF